MEENKIENAFTEVEIVIKNLTEDLRNRIPEEFVKIIQTHKNEKHVFKFNKDISINEQQMLEETKTILTIIYRDFLCSKEEKQQLNNILIENENAFQKEIEEKYSIEKLFANKKKMLEDETKEEVALVKYKEGFWQKILKKIASIFKK